MPLLDSASRIAAEEGAAFALFARWMSQLDVVLQDDGGLRAGLEEPARAR